MAESHVVSGLVERRARIAGKIAHLREQMRALEKDIAHLDASIALFDPNYRVRDIRAIRPAIVSQWFANGEVSRLAMDALREAAGPISTRQLGEVMAARKGLKPQNGDEWDRLLKCVIGALQRFEKKGIVRMVGRDYTPGKSMLWQLI